MKTVKAKVKSTTIFAAVATVENGEVVTQDLEPLTTTTRVTESNAVKVYRNESGETIENGAALLIKGIETNETVYEMPLDDFLHFYEIWANPEETENEEV